MIILEMFIKMVKNPIIFLFPKVGIDYNELA